MNARSPKTLSLLLATISLDWAGVSIAATTNSWRLEAGPLTLDIQVSKTAHLFHVVDQISQWSEFCHRQYSRYLKRWTAG
jgi:multisubunit Na+/H+ antiporter MnhE subunit